MLAVHGQKILSVAIAKKLSDCVDGLVDEVRFMY